MEGKCCDNCKYGYVNGGLVPSPLPCHGCMPNNKNWIASIGEYKKPCTVEPIKSCGNCAWKTECRILICTLTDESDCDFYPSRWQPEPPKVEKPAVRVKFLSINASPFTNSTTEGFNKIFENACGQNNIDTIRLNLYSESIPDCKGDYGVPSKLSDIQNLVLGIDGIFVSSPCHWFNTPIMLKTFIDHLTCIDKLIWQKARPMCVCVYSPEGGEYGTLSSIILPLNMMGFSLPANGYAYYNGVDKWAYDEIKEMPIRMVEMAEVSK